MENLLCVGPRGNRIKSLGSPVTGLWDSKASCALGGTQGPHCMLGNCSPLSYIPSSGFQAFEHVFKSFCFPDSFTSPNRLLFALYHPINCFPRCFLWLPLVAPPVHCHSPASWLYIPASLFIQCRLWIYFLTVRTCLSKRQLEIATRADLSLSSFPISGNSSATFQLPKPQIQASFLSSPFPSPGGEVGGGSLLPTVYIPCQPCFPNTCLQSSSLSSLLPLP